MKTKLYVRITDLLYNRLLLFVSQTSMNVRRVLCHVQLTLFVSTRRARTNASASMATARMASTNVKVCITSRNPTDLFLTGQYSNSNTSIIVLQHAQ